MKTRAILVFLIACGGGNTVVPDAAPGFGDIPLLSSSDPAVLAAGSAISVQLQGDGFAPDAIVLWDGAPRMASSASATVVTFELVADEIELPAAHEVRVINPNGGMSNALAIDVVEPLPVPTLTALVPMQASAGSAGFELQLSGHDFAPAAVVRWAGQARPTTFVDALHLTATIATADLAIGGSFDVTVVNPAPGGGASNAVPFDVFAATTERISLDDAGAQLTNASTTVAVSDDGRYAAFWTRVAAVPADTNGKFDIYIRDTCRGATGCTATTFPASVSTAGAFSAMGDVLQWIATTPDLRIIAFIGGTDLTPGGAPTPRTIFIRDTCIGATGCTPSTTVGMTFTSSAQPTFDLSDDGRYIAFTTTEALDAVNDTNGSSDIYVYDTCRNGQTGCVPQNFLVSATSAGAAGTGASESPRMSADGRYIAFRSTASDLVADDTNFSRDVFVRDTCLGVATGCVPATQRVSVNTAGAEGVNASTAGEIDPTGRYVLFATSNNFDPIDTQTGNDFYLRDTCAGAASCTPSTTLVSIHPGNTADDNVYTTEINPNTRLSAGARYIALATFSNGLVAGDTNGRRDVFLRDTCIGAASCTPSTVILSNGLGGVAGSGSSPSGTFTMSRNAHFMVFDGGSSNLVTGDTNNVDDVFLAPTGL